MTFFGVNSETLSDVVADKAYSDLRTEKGPSSGDDFTDFSRIGFTVTTKAGAKVSVYADRCGLELPDGAMADGGMMYSSVSKLGTISASRGGTVPSRHRGDSCPSDEVVGGFFIDFGTVRAPRRRSTDVIDVTPSSRGSIAFGRRSSRTALSTALEPTGTPSPRTVDGPASGVADASWVSAWPRTHRRAACVKSKISDAPYHRHDVVPITASVRWHGASTPSTRRCPQL